jgi:hypothetical protein
MLSNAIKYDGMKCKSSKAVPAKVRTLLYDIRNAKIIEQIKQVNAWQVSGLPSGRRAV